METIAAIQAEIVEEFDMFEDWMEKYEYIIELGKTLPIIDNKHKIDDNLIKGCQSRVWLHAEYNNEAIVYTADSDAIITKGIIALLIRLLSNQKTKDMLKEVYNSKNLNKIIILIDQDEKEETINLIPFSEFYFNTKQSDPKAYICKNYTCDLPTSDLEKIRQQLEE